jgi:hypothetical protein
MLVIETIQRLFNRSIRFQPRIILALIFALLLAGIITWQTNVYLSNSPQKGENYITLQAKTEAQALGRDPCDILSEWLAKAKSTNDKQAIRDIQMAQKFLGCRNIQKRQNR